MKLIYVCQAFIRFDKYDLKLINKFSLFHKANIKKNAWIQHSSVVYGGLPSLWRTVSQQYIQYTQYITQYVSNLNNMIFTL